MDKKFTQEDDALLAELGVDIEPKNTAVRTPREERIVAGFEEIQRFVDTHGRAPQHGEGRDIFERLYAVVRLSPLARPASGRSRRNRSTTTSTGASFRTSRPGSRISWPATCSRARCQGPRHRIAVLSRHRRSRSRLRDGRAPDTGRRRRVQVGGHQHRQGAAVLQAEVSLVQGLADFGNRNERLRQPGRHPRGARPAVASRPRVARDFSPAIRRTASRLFPQWSTMMVSRRRANPCPY